MKNPYVVYADLTTQSEYLSRVVQTDTLEGAGIVNYARYWHGYLVWLNPFFSIFNLSDMRVMSMCFQFTLLLWVLLEIKKSNHVYCNGYVYKDFYLERVLIYEKYE